MSRARKGETPRLVVNSKGASFRPFDRYGAPIKGMSWANISFDRETGKGSYFLRFEPGAKSLPHEHGAREEFLVIEGELVDSDGTTFSAGDFVSYDPGTCHAAHSPNGCLLAVFMRGHNRPLDGEP